MIEAHMSWRGEIVRELVLKRLQEAISDGAVTCCVGANR